MIQKHNIDQSVFNNLTLVKLSDVQNYLDGNESNLEKEIESITKDEGKIKYGLINDLKVSSSTRGKNIIWVIINYGIY